MAVTHEKLPNVRTVGDLVAALAGVDPDTPVVMARDAEGNGFGPLAEINDQMRYQPTTTWSGEVANQTEVLAAAGLDLDDEGHFGPDETVDVIVLWPLN